MWSTVVVLSCLFLAVCLIGIGWAFSAWIGILFLFLFLLPITVGGVSVFRQSWKENAK
jgi:hypothetical protein